LGRQNPSSKTLKQEFGAKKTPEQAAKEKFGPFSSECVDYPHGRAGSGINSDYAGDRRQRRLAMKRGQSSWGVCCTGLVRC
jgi:hypothetical protein